VSSNAKKLLKSFYGKKKRVISPPPMTSNHLLPARRLLWVCGAALGLVIELAATLHGAFARTAPQFEALPLVRSRQNHLLLRAFINGKPAWLTVDSGAPVARLP
jgi:hypothetical protein